MMIVAESYTSLMLDPDWTIRIEVRYEMDAMWLYIRAQGPLGNFAPTMDGYRRMLACYTEFRSLERVSMLADRNFSQYFERI